MNIPFQFGRIAMGDNFIDRNQELQRLKQNFASLTNTILISPRRWGKSSLVALAAQQIQKENKKIKVCQIDFYQARTPNEFYEILITGLLNATNTKLDEFVQRSKEMFKSLLPKFSFGSLSGEQISIGFEWNDIKKSQDQLLDLAESIAISKNLKLIIAIDEFQNIAEFSDGVSFQKRLRQFGKNINMSPIAYPVLNVI